MKRYRVKLERIALDEISEVHRWLHKRSPAAAAGWFNELFDAVDSLATFPARCPRARESVEFDREIRQLIIGSYRVLFAIVRDEVHIVHVRHVVRRDFHEGEF